MAEIEVKVGISLRDLVDSLKKLPKEDREFFIENLLAATSPEYLHSIQEAREDCKAGRVVSLNEALGKESPSESLPLIEVQGSYYEASGKGYFSVGARRKGAT